MPVSAPTPVSSPTASSPPPLRPVTPPINDTTQASTSAPQASSPAQPPRPTPNGSTPASTPPNGDSDDMELDDDGEESLGLNGKADKVDNDAESEWSSDDWMADMRRVKVYELVGARWTDRGTALCTGVYDEDKDQAAIVAKSEVTDVELLRCEIRASDVYQRQQDTLIVWTEPDGTDYALSFQDVEGCAEIWDFIIEVQRHFRGKNPSSPVASGSAGDSSEEKKLTVSSIIASGRLPDPAFGIISEIERAIKLIGRTPTGKDRICEYILTEDYIKSLIDVMKQAEDLESIADLHAIFCLMQTILMMNDHGIYDYILQEDVFLGVVGILEYDPEFPDSKASYRDFLTTSSHFRQPIPFNDETIRRKIHQTHRLQFLKDVVLARVLDDPTFNVLNSFILFNLIDILNHIQHDEPWLRELFSVFEDDWEAKQKQKLAGEGGDKVKEEDAAAAGKNEDEKKERASSPDKGKEKAKAEDDPDSTSQSSQSPTSLRTEALLLIHQLCQMSKSVQIPARLALCRTLVDRGVLKAIEWAFGQDDPATMNAAGEILLVIVDHDITGVRGFVMGEAEKEKEKEGGGEPKGLIWALIKLLGGRKDLAFKSQMADLLRMLLELEGGPGENIAKVMVRNRTREDPITERFLQFFYDSCITSLYKPVLDLPEFKNLTEPVLNLHREQDSLLLYLCDLLSTFFVQHTHRSQFFILASNISTRVASLFRAKDKHLRLAALRFFRAALKINNAFVYHHLFKHHLFLPILELTARESQRDNLLSSSCQEFFEYVRKENIKLVLSHIMEQYESRIRDLAKIPLISQRFLALIQRWEANNEPPPPRSVTPEVNPPANNRRWGQGEAPESEEEKWFDSPDDDDASQDLNPWERFARSQSKRKRPRGKADASNKKSPSEVSRPINPRFNPSSIRLGLVDYDDDDEFGGLDTSEQDSSPTASRSTFVPILSPSPIPHSSPTIPNRTLPLRPTASTSTSSPSIPSNPVLSPDRSLTRTISFRAMGEQPARSKGDLPLPPTTPPRRDTSPSPSSGLLLEDSMSDLGPALRLSEKRRREEEEDEMLALLVNKGKRPTPTVDDKEKNDGTATVPSVSASTKEDGTKKIKLSLKSGIGVRSSQSAPSNLSGSAEQKTSPWLDKKYSDEA